MSRYHSFLNSGVLILSQYKGEEPFTSFLKKYFAQHKKHGSKDRKQITQLCYCYFRLGKALPETPVEEKILIGLFLCSSEPNEMLETIKPEWNDKVKFSLDEKLSFVNYQLSSLFPWKEELSDGIDHEIFSKLFFFQPDLFLRLRPGKEQSVKQKLQQAGIDFKIISDTCLAFPNSSGIDKVIELDKEAVVQDCNSQRIGDFFPLPGVRSPLAAWDCCTGSGGKSIMLYDLYPDIDLTVSDVRESILINLKKRFREAGITKFKSFIHDLAHNSRLIAPDSNLILCDVPCTGSGTWGRTPEQLYFFDEKKIEEYAYLQRKIVSNIISHLKENGFLVYITCSVFKKENEEMINYIKQEFSLELIEKKLLKGYDKKADTMFVAVMKKAL